MLAARKSASVFYLLTHLATMSQKALGLIAPKTIKVAYTKVHPFYIWQPDDDLAALLMASLFLTR